MATPRFLRALALLACLYLPLTPVQAAAEAQASVPAILHILDYMAVDYPGVIKNGQVVNAAEFEEQTEFAGQVGALMARLPDNPARARLMHEAQTLAQAVASRAPGEQVARQARAMYADLIRAYDVITAPGRAPDLAQGAALFKQHCAGCHGVQGRGDGPQGAGLEPPPVNFHEAERQDQRSVYGLYSTITLGVGGTGMAGYAAQLSEEQRWSLAFHVANYPASDTQRSRGEALWREGRLHDVFTDLATLTGVTPQQMRARFGEDGVAVLAFLRAHPGALAAPGARLAFSAHTLEESLAAYGSGDRVRAYQLAVAAYLEGFELAETALSAVDQPLREEIERRMTAYRQNVQGGVTMAQLTSQVGELRTLLGRAGERLASRQLSPGMAAGSAFIILLREGVEAILVLAAVIAFLVKTGRRDQLRYVHAGWLAALALGGLTWFMAAHFINVSGAGREVTEGVVALIAAAMLVYVGYWLHQQRHAGRWHEYLRGRLNDATRTNTMWTLVGIAFLAVYREVFETVLFYQTLAMQVGEDNGRYLAMGIVGAGLVLALVTWAIFRLSIRLPLKLFFSVNAVLLLALAVVFTGKGVAALQEAGKLPVSPVDMPSIDLLGIYPNLQGLALQLALVAAMGGWVWYSRRRPSGR